MATETKCPHCGKPVPSTALQGICPECMLKAGLADTGEVGPDGTVVAKTPPPPAPRVDELAPHFPQLEIIECLGRGGMGAVYKARQPKLDRLVALKILSRKSDRGISDTEFAARFQQEARALARLSHPDIVAVYDFGEAGGFHYLLMEYVDGLTLRQLLQSRKLAPEEALAIVPKICEALQFAHERGIVHRDIKPENILLDKQGRVKIADFGIAKMLGPDVAAQALTGVKDRLGTPHYMAPEQVEKPATVDHRADIFSLGVVFYEMLTGELPLGKFAPPSRKVQVDVRLDEVVLHALEKEPERRYQHASEVKADVETIAATGENATVSPPKPSPSRADYRHYHSGSTRLKDCWMWDPRIAWLFFLVPLVVTLPLIPFLFRQAGFHSLWLLAFDVGGLALALTYLVVGIKVRRLKTTRAAKGGEVAEALIAGKTFQSPGVAILRADTLELVPITGDSIPLVRSDIVAVREVTWFNGVRLWTKMGLILALQGGARIGVALPRPIGERWKARLSSKCGADRVTPNRNSTTDAGGKTVTVARWTARVLGTLLLVFYGVFVLAEGLPPIASQPEGVQLNFVALGLMLAGFAVGWKREGTAALLIASGWTLWHISEGRISWDLFQTPLPVAGLYAFCWWATHGRRTGVVAGTTAALAMALGLGRLFVPTSVFVHGQIVDALTGEPVQNVELRLLPRPQRADQGDYPNARSGQDGRYRLYVGWYAAGKQVALTADGYTALTTNLGSRELGQRNVSRDFVLLPRAGSRGDVTASPATAPPVVIETFPVSGASDVDPAITELRARFSKPVYGAAWCQLGDDSVPEVTGPPRYVDERTCVLPVRLRPGRVYALWLNTEAHLTFRDHDERPALPYLLVFQTKP